MCNLYSLTKGQRAIIELARAMRDMTGNLPPLPGIFPDYMAPIVRTAQDGVRELALARWGMPSPRNRLKESAEKRAAKLTAKGQPLPDMEWMVRIEPDSGVTNIRNVVSPHWRRWLGPANRCLVPFTSFSEHNKDHGGDVWFALGEDRPLAFFAGIWVQGWTSVRRMKEGAVTSDLFGFLTCEPTEPVASVHPKAMPVILTEPAEWNAWMAAPWEEARALQRPLPSGLLKIVARGRKSDGEDAAGSPE